MKEIPRQVKEIANKNGCNAVNYRGLYKGKEVYSIYFIQPNGTVAPTGLPTLLVYGKEGYDVVCGYESFEILRSTIRLKLASLHRSP